MSHDKFNDTIASLLEQGRINHVIDNLQARFSADLHNFPEISDLIARLEPVADTYRNLRQFLINGLPDLERDAMLHWIKDSLRDLGRRYLYIINQNRPDPMFSEYRLLKLRGTSLENLFSELEKADYHLSKALETEADTGSFLRKREETVERIFRTVWALPPLTPEEASLLESKLLDPALDFSIKSQIVSALLLSLLKFNDPARFLLLLKAYSQADDERLEARILTAIILVLARWGNSALANEEISERLDTLQESLLTYARLREVVMTLIRTRDTDRVSREVNEAFSSTMKGITPEMLEKLQKEGLSVDASETGMNPEWEKLMKNKDLEEKMQAINDMQLEGMDVMMQTFSRLKNFGFFRSVANWFLPFSTAHTQVAPLFESFSEEGFSAMADATEMCSGDRFSFVLGLLQMPSERRDMLGNSISASLDMIKDQIKDRDNVRRRSPFSAEVLSFARDLYRFAKIYPRRKDFYDPFEVPLDFRSIPVLGATLNENDIMLTAADFYFRHGYYQLAGPLYEDAAAAGGAERHIFEKIGYCLQTEGDFTGALESYEKADLFSTDADRSSTWLIKRLAFCNKALGRYEAAADYYRKLLEANPDDLKVEFHLASVLLRSGDFKRAKEIISKVHYLVPDHKICNRIYTRLKGHEAFMEGDYKQAMELYAKAQGDQKRAEYISDLRSELTQLYSEADGTLLAILLDE